MGKFVLVLIIGTFGLPSGAMAATGSFQFGFIADSQLEVDGVSGEADGDGISINGSIMPSDSGLLFFASHLAREYEDVLDINQTRLGVGWSGGRDNLGFWVGANYEQLEVDDSDADGIGLRGGLSYAFNDVFGMYGEIGSYAVSEESTDISGGEFSIGLAFIVAPNISIFADIRAQVLEVEDDVFGVDDEFTMTDLRLGVGYFF